METRCKAGDLAIVVHAFHRGNVGRIVEVVAPHDGSGDLVFKEKGVVWLVKCAHPMTWSVGQRRIRRKRGPVPDTMLWPIRGMPSTEERGSRSATSVPAVTEKMQEA